MAEAIPVKNFGRIRISAVTYPDYMPGGDVHIEDPDGYTLLIGHSG